MSKDNIIFKLINEVEARFTFYWVEKLDQVFFFFYLMLSKKKIYENQFPSDIFYSPYKYIFLTHKGRKKETDVICIMIAIGHFLWGGIFVI